MMTLTLGFRGLCAFVERDDGMVDVLLNPTNGSHRATLTVRTEDLDPDSVDSLSRWRPDFLGHVPVNEGNVQQVQIAVWDLTGVRVSFPGVRHACWMKQDVIALGNYHCGARTLRYPAGFGIVELGKCQIEAVDLQRFRMTRRATNEDYPVHVATELRCTGLPMELFSSRGIICFSANANPVAFVSNLSSHIDRNQPLHHFENYYDVILNRENEPIDPSKRWKIEPAKDDNGQFKPMTVDVYDCVPPAGGP